MRLYILLISLSFFNTVRGYNTSCAENYRLGFEYISENKVYGASGCTDVSDCQSKCSLDNSCDGYSSSPSKFIMASGQQTTCIVLDQGLKCWGVIVGEIGINYGDGPGEMGTNLPFIDMGTDTISKMGIGNSHICVLLSNGKVKCWGNNGYRQVGVDGIPTFTNTPPADPLNLGADATDICVGMHHSCAVLSDGGVKCWGKNGYGELGMPKTTSYSTVPANSINMGGSATQISCGDAYTCAIMSTGDVKCWGMKGAHLGQGDYDDRESPVPVDFGTGRTAVQIVAGRRHVCVLMDNSQVKCWGSGIYLGRDEVTYDQGDEPGEMGDNLAVTDLGTVGTVVSLSEGPEFRSVCALFDNGKLKCWGANTYGLGFVSSDNVVGNGPGEMGDNLPFVDLGTGRTAVAVTGGSQFHCAVLDDASVKCFGFNAYGQLGYGDTTNRGKAADSVGDNLATVSLGGSAKLLSLSYGTLQSGTGDGYTKSAACLSCPNGTVNAAGDLINGSVTYCDRLVPCAQNEFVNTDHQCETCPAATYNDVGDTVVGSCDDTEKCIANYHVKTEYSSNLLKYGSTSCSDTVDCKTKCTADSACAGYSLINDHHIYASDATCEVSDGKALCWGKGSYYQGGWGSTADKVTPQEIISSGVKSLHLDAMMGCALMDDGTVKCWGLQADDTTQIQTPTDIGLTDIKQIVVRRMRRYALTNSGEIWAWGDCTLSACGSAASSPQATPVKIPGVIGAEKIDYNAHKFCWLISGEIKCIGLKTGVFGSSGSTSTPVTLTGVSNVKDFTLAYNGIYVVTTNGEVKVRGGPYMGVGSSAIGYEQFQDMGLSDVKMVTESTTGNDGGCALMNSGTAKCWGSNNYGQVGDQTSGTNRLFPVDVLDINGNIATGITSLSRSRYRLAFVIDGWSYVVSSTVTSTVYPTKPTGLSQYIPSMSYGLLESGAANSFAKGAKTCQPCPTGYNNEGMDDPLLDDTTCDFIPCQINERITNGQCTPCTAGATRAAGDSDPLVDTFCTCGVNQFVSSGVCTECPSGSTRAAGDDASGADTVCLIAPCAKDYHVKDNVCVPCPTGMTNDAGDTNANGDTYCDSTFVCGEDQYVSNHQCVDCPAAKTAPYGSNPAGADTECNWIVCKRDEYSNGASCQSCATGSYNDPGDTTETVTTCNDAQICKENHQLSFKYTLQANYQISNGAGYLGENAITDFDYAKKLCDLDSSCNGLTKDSSNNYYLSDGTASSNSAYDAYNINRAAFDCLACRGSGTHAAGEDPNSATGITNCAYADCPANYGSSGGSCVACTGGKVRNPPINPEQDHICTIVPCAADEHVKISISKTQNSLKYGTASCSSDSDCETKCAMSASCDGYTNNGFGIVNAWGGDAGTNPGITGGIVSITMSGNSGAALKTDGTVEVWGKADSGGTHPGGLTGVTKIVSVGQAGGTFAALKDDGTVVIWGKDLGPTTITDVVDIVSTGFTFLFITSDGSLHPHGPGFRGGCDTGGAAYTGHDPATWGWSCKPNGVTAGVQIAHNSQGFAVLQSDGSVKTWGGGPYRGDPNIGAGSGITKIFAGNSAFVALKSDGTVVAWGAPDRGATVPAGLTDVVDIVPGGDAFYAIKTDGSVVAWGLSTYYTLNVPSGLTGVTKIFLAGAQTATALKSDGTTVTWGNPNYGGNQASITGVVDITTFDQATAVLKSDGSVVAFGWSTYISGWYNNQDLTSGVIKIFARYQRFAALKDDGSVVTFGSGGVVATGIGAGSGVTDIIHNTAFPAEYGDHTFVAVTSPQFEYGPLVAGSGASFAISSQTQCTACPAGSTNEAGDTDINGETQCDWGTCGLNEYASNKQCVACAPGTFNDAGDDAGVDSTCDDPDTCDENEYSDGTQCLACPGSGTNEAGDRANVVTTCDFPTCGANERVVSNACVACGAGTFNDAGDDAGGADTTCDDAEVCPANHYALTNYVSSTNKYGTTSCSSASDCETKCTSDGTCKGYTSLGFGAVKSWGNPSYGGGTIPSGLTSGIAKVVGAETAFAALKTDGTVKAWGGYSGGDVPSGLTGVVDIVSSQHSFAALKSDGGVKAWGHSNHGGTDPGITSGVTKIFSNDHAFAALKTDGSVQVWGNPSNGGTDPGITSGVVTIFSTGQAFAALKTDGSLQVWGYSDYGGSDPGITSGVQTIFSNYYAFAALKTDGSVVAWGNPSNGGTDPGIGAGSGITEIFSTDSAFAALKSDGSVVAWGNPSNGGTDPGITSGVVKIFSTVFAFAALKTDGSVQVWGHPDRGGTDPGIGAGSGITEIFSTSWAFAALKTDGSVKAWGNPTYGGADPGITGGVVDVVGNNYAFAAVKSDGSVQVWGHPDMGGTDPGITSGVTTIFATNVDFLAAIESLEYGPLVAGSGSSHEKSGTCTACTNGGTNAGGKVDSGLVCVYPDCQTDQYSTGNGQCLTCPVGRFMPTPINPSTAAQCTCLADQYVQGYTADSSKRYAGTSCTDVSDCKTKCSADSACAGYTIDKQTILATGNNHACAIQNDGSIECWGRGQYNGQQGDGVNADNTVPGPVSVITGATDALTAVQISAGSDHTCSVMKDGALYCWGRNWKGGLGIGSVTDHNTPQVVLQDVKSVACGDFHTCALMNSGSVKCWGYNNYGQLGDGTTTDSLSPIDVSGLTDVIQIFSGSSAKHTCVIKSSGNVWCWGWNKYGQLGDGSPLDAGVPPVQVSGIANAEQVSTGAQHTCILLAGGTVKCMGAGSMGRLADGNAGFHNEATPIDTQFSNVIEIKCGAYSTCALLGDGTVKCAGRNNYGQLGDGTTTDNGVPQTAIGISSALQLSSGTYFSCVAMSGSFSCWGQNDYYMLGDGTQTSQSTPISPVTMVIASPSNLEYGSLVSGSGDSYTNGASCQSCPSGFTNAAGDDPNGADTECDFTPCALNHYVSGTGNSRVCTACAGGQFSAGGLVTECSGTEYCDVDQKVVSNACVNCPAGQQNALGVATDKSGADGTCAEAPCVANQYSDGSICQNCPQHTGANSAGLDPTAGVTECVPTTCKKDQHVENNACKLCDSSSYRLAGDQVFGGDTHCFCKDDHKVINKACVACEAGSSNPNLCYSGLQDHYCVCHENYHVVSNLCTACPAGATRPAGDYAGNADTHCICGEDQHVVSNACVACPAGTKRPAGDDSSGPDTPCSCQENEHVKNVSNVLQCTACPTGSLRAAGDLVADGETACACPENFHVSGGTCVACVASTRATGDDPLAGDTHCACNENHFVSSNVCTPCTADSSKEAGDDAGGDDTACGCDENFYSNGDGTCSACADGSSAAAGSNPLEASTCDCNDNYELIGASCSACDSTEESTGGAACTCKENHYVSSGACTACAAGSTRPAGDDKTENTACTNTICGENERVEGNVCAPCIAGMIRAAGDDATGADTECAYTGTTHTVSTAGSFAFRIDALGNNAEMTIRVGETHTFYRVSGGDPFRIVSKEDCDGNGCDQGQYSSLPTSSLGLNDAVKDVSVTVFTPTVAGTYYYVSTENGYRKGIITVKWPLCSITYPTTTLTESCEMDSEQILTGDLTITYELARLRALRVPLGAQEGDVPQIMASEGGRHFTVSGGHKLSIENIDLNGGRGSEGGSILIDNGEIDANNVKFTDNVATSAGGAIRVKNSASKINMANIMFEDNQGSEGGAISIQDTLLQKVEIHGSDFKNNRAASGDGGAIKADSELNITGSNFENNAANTGEGGGISATKDVTMSGSSFKNNKALKGGAMKSSGNKVVLSNMVVEANEAVEDGGAFNAENAEFDVRTTTFLANKAKRGAAFKTRSTGCTTDCKPIKIRSSSMEGNEATVAGGAVDFDGDASAEPQFWVQDTELKNNKAKGQANDFKQRGASVKIKAIDSDVGTIEGGAVDATCEPGQCDSRPHSTCEVTATGTKCACDGTNRHLSGKECKAHKVCTGLGLDVEIRAPDKDHDRLCGTQSIADLTYKLDAKGQELANLIEAKLVSEGVAADEAYALAVEVFGEINKCE